VVILPIVPCSLLPPCVLVVFIGAPGRLPLCLGCCLALCSGSSVGHLYVGLLNSIVMLMTKINDGAINQ
jgi:hypothetical protein